MKNRLNCPILQFLMYFPWARFEVMIEVKNIRNKLRKIEHMIDRSLDIKVDDVL